MMATAVLLPFGRDSRLRRTEATSMSQRSGKSCAYSGRAVGRPLVFCEGVPERERWDDVKGSQPNEL